MKKRSFYAEANEGIQRIWYVDLLWEKSKNFPVFQIELSNIDGIDQVVWFHEGGPQPTCREIVAHCKRIVDADLSFPILLTKDHRVLDGMHRIARCLMHGHKTIDARIFETMPEPDERREWPGPTSHS